MITVQNPYSVWQENLELGSVADSIRNHPALASEIQIALQVWWEAQQAQFETEKAAIAAQQQQAVEAAIATANAGSNAQIADYQAQIATLTQELDALKNPPAPVENWDGIVAALRGTSLWAKVYVAAGSNLRANVSWTLLYGTLTRTHNLADFQFAISDLRQAMADSAIGDFNAAELEQINQTLTQTGFSFLLK